MLFSIILTQGYYYILAILKGANLHGIVGDDGFSKTVMMHCICGFLKLSTEAVKVNGKLIGKREGFSESLSFVIEAPGF